MQALMNRRQEEPMRLRAAGKLVATRPIDSPVGPLWLGASEQGIMHLVAASEPEWLFNKAMASVGAKMHLDMACRQLEEYFVGQRQQFSLALAPQGTEFQRAVWQALLGIPFGQTCSYSDIAVRLSKPKAIRAVGAANGANPIAIIIPCHRVIGKGGALTGYAWGLEMKSHLLGLESGQPVLL